MANFYFTATYGGIELLVSRLEDVGGRDIAVQSPSRGDQHVLQDRGQTHHTSSAEILFVDQPGADPFIDRFEQFKQLVNAGDAQIFMHPLEGGYRARIGEFRSTLSADQQMVSVNCTILAEDEPQQVFPAGAGVSSQAGLEAVSVAAGLTTNALTAVGLASPVPAACTAAATSWTTTANLDTQVVLGDVATLTQQISDETDRLDLLTDLNKWPAYQAMVNLQYQVTRAAASVTSSSEQLFDLTVAQPTPLLSICAQIYGSANAEDQATATAQRNRVRRPGLVPAGTVLKMQAPGATT